MNRPLSIAKHGLAILVFAVASMSLSACSTLYRYNVPARGTTISESVVTCTSPYSLAVGCSTEELAGIDMLMHGLEFKLASSTDGSTILVMPKKVRGGTSVFANLVFDSVVSQLSERSLMLQKAVAIQEDYWEGPVIILGYFIVVDGNAHDALSNYSLDQEKVSDRD